MKPYRIILAGEDPLAYNDAEKIVADGLAEPSFADIRHMTEIISISAVLDDVVYNRVFQLFECIKEATRRALLAKETFPITLLYKNVACVVREPSSSNIYSSSWRTISNLAAAIKETIVNSKH